MGFLQDLCCPLTERSRLPPVQGSTGAWLQLGEGVAIDPVEDEIRPYLVLVVVGIVLEGETEHVAQFEIIDFGSSELSALEANVLSVLLPA